MIDITNRGRAAEKTAVALGYFDGLHLGHVGVISAALSQQGLKPAVFTFNCDTTLPKFRGPEDIISFENKCELMERLGVQYIYAPDFAEVCTLTDEEFVKNILIDRLNAGYACCGRNFRFGKGGSGTPERLAEIGAKYGMRAGVVPDVCLDGQIISSTRIREHIRRGEIEQANRLLGYDLWYRLPVVRGNEIGRTINFPTINQIIPDTNIIPRHGVYKSYVEIDGKQYHGVTNIGIKPTVVRHDGTGTVMETHIIGYSGDLYGQNIAVALVRFIRPEVKFPGLEELKQQIARDKENAMHRTVD
ncbi:MAG: riboflavin biosynthesis protein RibF [Oscillospiraceae bacterium]|nr:riboflavin biosynthesis protein RibF [Oscillospiraceae bacterium]